jgi:hypothetical protein
MSRQSLVDRLVSDLVLGRVRSLAFVVPSDITRTMPLYDVAIATAPRVEDRDRRRPLLVRHARARAARELRNRCERRGE